MALLSTPLDTWNSTPPVTKAFTITLLVASLGYQYASFTATHTEGKSPVYFAWLLLYPGWWIYNPWTIVTCVLVEPSIFGVRKGNSLVFFHLSNFTLGFAVGYLASWKPYFHCAVVTVL